MWCAQKFVSGHQCVRSQLYQLLVEDGEELLHDMDQNMGTGEITETIAGNEAEEGLKPVISLHALLGTGDSQTMRLQGKIKTFTVVILVDSGSTHNFINQGVVKRGASYTDYKWTQCVCSQWSSNVGARYVSWSLLEGWRCYTAN